jgi:hypothetical protein
MAQKTVIELIDDIDGSEATETVSFGLDNVDYEIDLTDDKANELRRIIGDYAPFARTVKSAGKPLTDKRTKNTRELSEAIREWARNNGHEINGRGRIPDHIVNLYRARKSPVRGPHGHAEPVAGQSAPQQPTESAAPSGTVAEPFARSPEPALDGPHGHAEPVTDQAATDQADQGPATPVAAAPGPVIRVPPAVIRKWAREHGISVPSTGRIPADVAEQYRKAMEGN